MSAKILWIFVNIILALLPIVTNFLLIKIMKIEREWYETLKDGELFIFSTTISASAIGVTFFQGSLDNSLGNLVFCILLLTIIFSTLLFGFASVLKFKQEKMPDEKLYAIASIGCAIAAIFCS